MKIALLTTAHHAILIANGQPARLDNSFDPTPVVKPFTPDASATWLLINLNPYDYDRAFRLADLGLGYPETGWVSLAEIARLRGPLRLSAERDLNWRAQKRPSDYAAETRARGRASA